MKLQGFLRPAHVFLLSLLLTLTACGGGGGGGSKPSGGNNPPPDNEPPVAAIALPGPESVTAGEETTLSGAASSDPDGEIASFKWEQLDGPAIDIANPAEPDLVFTAPATETDDTLVLRLTVTDNDGESDSAEGALSLHAIIKGNENPQADAGPDAQFSEGAGVVLDGSASSDTDGQIVAYAWTQLAGPEVELTAADSATPAFIAPAIDTEAKLKFRLIVTDDNGATHSDVVSITLVPHTGGNRAPFIGAVTGIPAGSIAEGSDLSLAATASDPDEDELDFTWDLLEPKDLTFDGIAFPATGAKLALTLPDVTADTDVALRLSVTDGNLTATQDIHFTIGFENQPPIVNVTTEPENLLDAGIAEGESFTLSAGATDPDNKHGLTYTWAQTAGSVDLTDEVAEITGSELTLVAPDITADETYGFQVTVTDVDGGKVTSEDVVFTVSFVNQAPVANAGADASGDENTEMTLNGESSFDPDGEAITYQWTQIAGAQATFIGGAEVASPTIHLPEIDSAEAVLIFSLVVTDVHGIPSVADTVNVTVNNVNRAPVIGGIEGPANLDEGADLVDVMLEAAGVNDPDGDNLSYQWVLPAGFVARSGIVGATLELARTPDIGPADDGGEHTFILRVTDDGAPAAFTEATHVIRLNFVNKVPQLTTSDIIGARNITEGSIARLTAAARDGDIVNGDEQELTYTWTLVDDGGLDGLPDAVQGAELSFTAPEVEAESVVARYRVIANDGLDESDPPTEIPITIEPDQIPPEIIAPEILDIDEGAGISFALNPTVSDNRTSADELDYEWIVPNGFSIQTGSDRQRELVVIGTPDVGPEGGSGTFGLNVTDADGNSENITFDVTVNFVNQPPVLGTVSGSRTVNDGTVGNTLQASGTDPDGQSLIFEWTRSVNDTSGINNEALGVTFPAVGEQLTFSAPDVTEDTTIIFSVVARDDLDLASESLEIAVEISSDPAPVIEGFEPATPVLDEGTALDLRVNATDLDRDDEDTTEHLIYEWTNVPQGFDVSGTDSATLSILATPDVGPGGQDYTFTVIVHDQDGNSVSRDISVHVGFVNEEPVVGDVEIRDSSGAPVAAVPEGPTDLVFSVDVTDADQEEGQAISYEWSVPEGFAVVGGINNATLRISATPNVIADTTFDSFYVEVGDGVADTVVKPASLVVNFVNQRPTAATGAFVEVPENVDLPGPEYVLDSSASFDPDNQDGAEQELTYRWSWNTLTGLELMSANGTVEMDGSIATLVTADSVINVTAVPNVTEDASIPVTLRVDDGSGAANSISDPAATQVRVQFANQDPVINAVSAAPVSPDEGEEVTLSANVSDPDDQIPALTWSQVIEGDETAVEITQNGDGTASFIAPDVGPENMILHFVVTADDGAGGIVDNSAVPLNVPVFFVNEDPVIKTATATPNPADEGVEVTLSGTATDPDGQDVSLTWSQVEGDERNVNIVNDGNGNATFIAPDVTGSENLVLDFILTADDGAEGVAQSEPVSVPVRFLNTPPNAPAAFAQPSPADEGETVVLVAAASDPDSAGNVEYVWTQSPDNSIQVDITPSGEFSHYFTAPDVGPNDNMVLNFEVIARDQDHAEHGNGESEPTAVAVPVVFVNQPPSIDSITASPQSATPGTEVTLAVTASDVDDQVLSYEWRQVDNGAPIADVMPQGDGSSAMFVAPQVTSLDGHTMEFEVVVNDQSGEPNATASDTVNVNLVFENTAPILNGVAVTPDSVDEGSTFHLIADVMDPDQELGQALTYTWTQRDGETPSVGTITSNPDGSATVVAPEVDVDTDLHFSVIVSDGVADAVTSNEVMVTVMEVPIRVDPIAFNDLTHAAPGLKHASNAITVSGLPDGMEVPISIDGGEYAIDGGAFTDVGGAMVGNGSMIVVRGDAPEIGGDTTQVTLTVGEGSLVASDTFDITAADSQLTLSASFRAVNLAWSEMQGVDRFELWYQPGEGEGFVRVLDEIPGSAIEATDDGLYLAQITGDEPKGFPVHLVDWEPDYGQYGLHGCNDYGCESLLAHEASLVQENSVDAVGYFKPETPEDAARFGDSVAISEDGQVMVVGSPHATSPSGAATDAGMISIYRRGADHTWELQQQFSNGVQGGLFGYSVAVSGDGHVIAVGQPELLTTNQSGGKLKVFEWSDQTLQWEASTVANSLVCDGAGQGVSVAVSKDGNRIAVGAPYDGPHLACQFAGQGRAMVYAQLYGGSTWQVESLLQSNTLSIGEEFGLDVDLDAGGTRLFVTTGVVAGEVELFKFDEDHPTGVPWNHFMTLSMGHPNGKVSASASGETFLSGGEIYGQLTPNEMSWGLKSDLVDVLASAGISEFTATDVALSSSADIAVLTNSVDVSTGSGVYVRPSGLGGDAIESGAAYVLSNESGTWTLERYLKASNPEAADRFGVSLDVGENGSTIIIGASGEDGGVGGANSEGQNDNSAPDSGAVYVY